VSVPRLLFIGLVFFLSLLLGCSRSLYEELTRFKKAATPADAELQRCLDDYAGRRLLVGEGYGYRLPFSSEETRRLLERVRRATEELRVVEAPGAAAAFAEEKLAAAGEIRRAFELLSSLTLDWEARLPAGPPGPQEPEPAELSHEELERWRADWARVNEAFASAGESFQNAALSLGAAILQAHGEGR